MFSQMLMLSSPAGANSVWVFVPNKACGQLVRRQEVAVLGSCEPNFSAPVHNHFAPALLGVYGGHVPG